MREWRAIPSIGCVNSWTITWAKRLTRGAQPSERGHSIRHHHVDPFVGPGRPGRRDGALAPCPRKNPQPGPDSPAVFARREVYRSAIRPPRRRWRRRVAMCAGNKTEGGVLPAGNPASSLSWMPRKSQSGGGRRSLADSSSPTPCPQRSCGRSKPGKALTASNYLKFISGHLRKCRQWATRSRPLPKCLRHRHQPSAAPNGRGSGIF